MSDDADVINSVADVFAGQVWDAVTELMGEPVPNVEATQTPTPKWDEVSQATRKLFTTLIVDEMLAAPVIQAVGLLVRKDRGERN